MDTLRTCMPARTPSRTCPVIPRRAQIVSWCINRCTRQCSRCVQHLHVLPTIHHKSRSWRQFHAHACSMHDPHAYQRACVALPEKILLVTAPELAASSAIVLRGANALRVPQGHAEDFVHLHRIWSTTGSAVRPAHCPCRRPACTHQHNQSGTRPRPLAQPGSP